MDDCLYDLLVDWAFDNDAQLLNDEAAFNALHRLVHNLLVDLRRQEKGRLLHWAHKVWEN